MPFQLDPEPGENEIECGNCGAVIDAGLSRCPVCGVNLYEPEESQPPGSPPVPSTPGLLARLTDILHRLSGKPYAAEQVFGDALDQAELYNDLLGKVGGDRAVAERLIAYERRLSPGANRSAWLRQAIRRWERDNRLEG